jgi:hypothetical protein
MQKTGNIIHIVGYWLANSCGNAKAKELLITLFEFVYVIDKAMR